MPSLPHHASGRTRSALRACRAQVAGVKAAHIGPEHQCLTRGQLLANSEADKGVDLVHISAAGNRAVARHH